jgi:FixJ family two-component response regulator
MSSLSTMSPPCSRLSSGCCARLVEVSTFSSPSDFLAAAPHEGIGCVLLDLSMPDMSGLDVQDTMHRSGIAMPVIFLSAYGDVPSAARAMREARSIFWSSQSGSRAARCDSTGARHRQRAGAAAYSRSEVEERLSRLTPRERQVCDLVIKGLLNKQIGSELGMTEKTVKVHRGQVMRKLEVHSVAALVR